MILAREDVWVIDEVNNIKIQIFLFRENKSANDIFHEVTIMYEL